MTSADRRVVDPDLAVGVVVIGRNEGERLKRCLRSLLAQGAGPLVYVDSGSEDDSVEFARSLGVHVVDLDRTLPFTMARARNFGFADLRARYPGLKWVQFVDGDCEVCPGWIETARSVLREREDVAVVCGRRRERFPQASIYNQLIDLEWDAPLGEVEESGGDVLFRAPVFEALGGFNGRMIAGEEPELCVRVRLAGHKVLRIAHDMTLHDAALFRFSQWWTRSRRSGHAYAEGMALHGFGPTRHRVKQTLSALAYGIGVPVALLATGVGLLPAPTAAASMALVGRAWWGSYRYRRARGDRPRHAALYASFCLLGKAPEAAGVLTYWANRARGRYAGLMEYKGPPMRSAAEDSVTSSGCAEAVG